MNPQKSQLQQQQKQEAEANQVLQQGQTAREFTAPEEMLRADAAEVTVPRSVTERLNQSLANEPRARQPWWRKLFNR
jgi:hypothetical protein